MQTVLGTKEGRDTFLQPKSQRNGSDGKDQVAADNRAYNTSIFLRFP